MAATNTLDFLSNLPESSLVIIRDSLQASGSFLLHHLFGVLLSKVDTSVTNGPSKADTDEQRMQPCRVCLTASNQSFSHYASVGRKLGVNLSAKLADGSFCFLDCCSDPNELRNEALKQATSHESEKQLRASPSKALDKPTAERIGQEELQKASPIFEQHPVTTDESQPTPPSPLDVRSPLQKLSALIALSVSQHREVVQREQPAGQHMDGSERGGTAGLTIAFDDLSALEAACQGSGKEVLALLNSCRRLQNASGKRASVVAVVHGDLLSDDERGLATILEHAADVVLQVEPLPTGNAADIHGQLPIIRRSEKFNTVLETTTRLPRKQKLQFRLLETGLRLTHIGGSNAGA